MMTTDSHPHDSHSELELTQASSVETELSHVELSLFASRLAAIADEMGVVLQRAAFSPNIRDRLDLSCAIFDHNGHLCAQAAHIPVHLGSMAYAMKDLVTSEQWREGDTLVVNDPYLGGTHLPDVTLISPLFYQQRCLGFVANRAHHANIGSDSPGSMPISSSLQEEGVVIAPTWLCRGGELCSKTFADILADIGHSDETEGDFLAQMSANQRGISRALGLVASIGSDRFIGGMAALNTYGARLAREHYQRIPDGEYLAIDHMDDDGQGNENIAIQVRIRVNGSNINCDFSGTAPQVSGNINCPLSVAAAGVFYVFRCLLPESAPACEGIFSPITLSAPTGTLLNAVRPAAVAAGNVETSMRVVDVVIKALAKAIPDLLPASSQGTMNNVAMGFEGDQQQLPWSYYETLGGGMGASQHYPGLSAVQAHMTNTLNTPVEVMETSFPVRVNRYHIRQHSGGDGLQAGGNGLVREYQFLHQAQVTLLTERRISKPQGAAGGGDANVGVNQLNGKLLSAKQQLSVVAGDCLTIATPGGGAWGEAS